MTADNIQQLSGKTAAQARGAARGEISRHRLPVLRRARRIDRRQQRAVVLSARSARGDADGLAVLAGSGAVHERVQRRRRSADRQQTCSVSAMYVHRRTRDLLTRRIINLFDAAAGHPNFGKTTDGGPQISAVGYDGLVDYDGIVLSAAASDSRSGTSSACRTPARARATICSRATVGSTFRNNNHPELDYGPSNQSAPHIFVANSAIVAAVRRQLQRRSRSGAAVRRSTRAASSTATATASSTSATSTQPRNAFRVEAVRRRRLARREEVRASAIRPRQRAGRSVQHLQPRQRRERERGVRPDVRHAGRRTCPAAKMQFGDAILPGAPVALCGDEHRAIGSLRRSTAPPTRSSSSPSISFAFRR